MSTLEDVEMVGDDDGYEVPDVDPPGVEPVVEEFLERCRISAGVRLFAQSVVRRMADHGLRVTRAASTSSGGVMITGYGYRVDRFVCVVLDDRRGAEVLLCTKDYDRELGGDDVIWALREAAYLAGPRRHQRPAKEFD